MAISDAQKRIYATAPTDDYLLETLELKHSGFTNGVRYITNAAKSFQGTLEDTVTVVTFDRLPFDAVPPKSGEENNLTLQVTLDNAGKVLMDELESAALTPTEKIAVTYRVYLNSDTSLPQNNPPLVLDVAEVTATNSGVSFQAGIINLRQRGFPTLLFTLDKYPGLRR